MEPDNSADYWLLMGLGHVLPCDIPTEAGEQTENYSRCSLNLEMARYHFHHLITHYGNKSKEIYIRGL